MRIQARDTGALIIDVQEKLFPHIHDHETLEQEQVKLIQGLRQLGIPMRMTEQYKKGLGNTIPSIREAFGQEEGYEKVAFSCCDNEHAMEAIAGLNRKNIILFGIETHVCVLQTALDLLEKGYHPVVIEDCVGSRKASDKRTAIERMRREGATISSLESILFELCRVAGSDSFKFISKLVK